MTHALATRVPNRALACSASLLAAVVLLVGSPSGADAALGKYFKRTEDRRCAVRDGASQRAHPIRMWRATAMSKARALLPQPLTKALVGVRELVRKHQAKRAEQKEIAPVQGRTAELLRALLPHIRGLSLRKRTLVATLLLGLFASQAGAGSATLSWTYDGDAPDRFRIYSRTPGLGYDGNPLWEGPGGLRRTTILGFKGLEYHFVMTAAKGDKESEHSEEVSLDFSQDSADTGGESTGLEAPTIGPGGVENFDSNISISGVSNFGF